MNIPIIDVHTHLGDVLVPNGGDIIEDGRVKKQMLLDPLHFFESVLWRGIPLPDWVFDRVTLAGAARSATATRANLRASMDKHGISKAVVLAVPPKVSFAQVIAAHKKDPDMLPFTGIDYAQLDNVEAQFEEDVAAGALGLKLHPILQKFGLNSVETYRVVEAFAPHNRPILFHSGVCEYYLDPRQKHLASPELGRIEDATEMVQDFQEVKFIVGHAGLESVDDVIAQMSQYKNVWVDISFQSPRRVTRLLEAFGPERVMYASDWPWGNMDVSIKVIKQICKGDVGLMRRLLCDNAAELLNVSPEPAREVEFSM